MDLVYVCLHETVRQYVCRHNLSRILKKVLVGLNIVQRFVELIATAKDQHCSKAKCKHRFMISYLFHKHALTCLEIYIYSKREAACTWKITIVRFKARSVRSLRIRI